MLTSGAARSRSVHLALDTSRGLRVGAVGLAALLTAVASQISVPLPFTPVPLTLQPTIVLLAGAVLGARAGASSQVAYLLAGLAGLPVFAWSPALLPGIARLMGPTGGYLLSYPLAALVVGALVERGWGRRYAGSVGVLAVGMGVTLTGGLVGLLIVTPEAATGGLAAAFQVGVLPFLGADLIKIAVAAPLLPLLARRRP